MQAILGADPLVFVLMTLVLMGGAALLLGQALANNWRPVRQVVFFAVLLAIGTRFLILSLFYGDPFFHFGDWMYGVVVDGICHIVYALLAYRVTLVNLTCRQYPWLYEPAGLLRYRRKSSA